MNTFPARKQATKPFVLTKRAEEILKAIHFHRYMTAYDVAHLLDKPSVLTSIRSILSSLSGGEDHKSAQYLYRFQLPHTTRGNTEKIYTLGSKGRDFLANELGLSVDNWSFSRPSKIRRISYSQVLHNLLLTRTLCAAAIWAAKQPNFKLSQIRTCYKLVRTPATTEVTKAGKTEKIKVIPDAWIEFERSDGKKYPILLEVDRGMEYSRKFKLHVRSRIEFIRSGAYKKIFGTDAVMIAYVTTSEAAENRETRRKTMCRWTQEVLADLHMENWSSIFRFSSVVFEELYASPIFDEPTWFQPNSPSPVPLFAP